jgi:hypothetical protein
MTSEQSLPTSAQTTRMVIDRFNEAFNQHDADALAPLLTDDTVFEDTSPAPDGQRIDGKAAVIAFWRMWFARNPDAGCIASCGAGSRGTCVAWTSSPCATAKWPRSSPT